MTAPQPTAFIQGQGTVSADQLNTFQQTCANIQQLRSFIGLPGMQAFVQGRNIPGDGFAGAYYWNSSSIGPDNGSSVIVPQPGVPGAWILMDLSIAQTPVILLNSSATLSTVNFGSLIELIGSSSFTVTLPSPINNGGAGFTFYNLNQSTQTLITPDNIFLGPGGNFNFGPLTIPGGYLFNVISDNTNWIVSSILITPNMAIITSDVTFVVPNGVFALKYSIIGGGGAGGGSPATGASQGSCGSGGNSGAFVTGTTICTPTQTFNIVIGAGGLGVSGANGTNGTATVFSSLATANGGGGGIFNGPFTQPGTIQPPLLSSFTGGFLGSNGTAGQPSFSIGPFAIVAGSGGGSILGGGGTGLVSGNGYPAGAFGAGGGGTANGENEPAFSGGNGLSGVVMLEW